MPLGSFRVSRAQRARVRSTWYSPDIGNIVSSIRIDSSIANDTHDADITNSLHGITTAQAYIYAYNSKGDSLTLKLAVAGLW